MWNLQEALELIRKLQPKLYSIGFHVCLGGGILNYGKSPNDLDLYIIPLEDESHHPDDKRLVYSKDFYTTLLNFLINEFGEPHFNEDYENLRTTFKYKQFYLLNDKEKIDIFII